MKIFYCFDRRHFLAACLGLTLPMQALDWPQWRGPDRTEVSRETGLLKSWPEDGPKRLWLYDRTGEGYSGPAIAGGKLYILGTRQEVESLFALDANSGQELWVSQIGRVFRERRGNGPRSTPTVDGSFVYALSGQGDLVCAQISDGKIIWRKSMIELGGSIETWGYTESVLVDGDHVVCTPGGSQGAIAAFDKRSGKLLWQTKEFTDSAQYASMIAVDLNGARQYIQLTMRHLVGVDAKDGKVLWKSSWPGRTAVVPTPIYRDRHVYITSGYGVGCKLVHIDADNKATDVYENKVMKNHHGGVVLVGDHLYGYSDGVGWVCQDFKSGEEVWSENQALGKGAVACADGMLYCLDENRGTVALVEASPKGWKEHGRLRLDPQSKIRPPQGRFWTHPVIANGKLYLRDQEYIYCYDVKQ
ncbi:MAG: PQQ-binding-like beta-propeller repeat protein [Verrucomicrobiota bacterium]